MRFGAKMPITRPSTLTPEEMEKLLERIANSGAKLTMTDPRVSAVHNWLLATIGGIIIIIGGWTITSINDLNNTMVQVIEQNKNADRTNDAQDRRFDNNDRRMDGLDSRLREVERKQR
jgi:hypothetical protein